MSESAKAPKAKYSYNLFELSDELIDSLSAFRVGTEQDVSEDESSSSESGSDVEEDEKNYSSTSTTQYNEVDEEANLRWELENLAHIRGSPFVLFQNPELAQTSQVLRVYKNWLSRDSLVQTPVAGLKSVVDNEKTSQSCVLLVGGGHFAGMIVRHRRDNHRKANISNPFANIEVIVSKSFHRYTTRRKQGGAQSASDNAHGKAKSAGSTIRRANERALEQEIKELLASWEPELKKCYRVFYRASGRSNKGLITGYKDAPLNSDDARLRTIPFATGRATFDECRRAWLQLTKVSIVDQPKIEIPKPKPVLSPTPSPKPAPKPKEELSPAQKYTAKIIDLVKRSKLPQLKSLFDDNKLSYDFRLVPETKYTATPTPLLYAAANNKHHVVTSLLQWGADPTLRNGQGQVLGDVAKANPKVVDALQISRAALGESVWKWDAAKVGPPLTKEDILTRDAEAKLKIRTEQERDMAEQEKREHESRIEGLIAKQGTSRTSGGVYQATRGLSEDDLKHIERERRARAAEARLARLNRN